MAKKPFSILINNDKNTRKTLDNIAQSCGFENFFLACLSDKNGFNFRIAYCYALKDFGTPESFVLRLKKGNAHTYKSVIDNYAGVKFNKNTIAYIETIKDVIDDLSELDKRKLAYSIRA